MSDIDHTLALNSAATDVLGQEEFLNMLKNPLTQFHPNDITALNMYNILNSAKRGLGTMTMTTTSGKFREAFVLGQK